MSTSLTFLSADHVSEESIHELVEALIESRTDRLPGQTGPGGVGDRGSQIVSSGSRTCIRSGLRRQDRPERSSWTCV